jgi:hypothetical protein
MHVRSVQSPPSNDQPMETRDRGAAFRSHLARAFSAASQVASGVAPAAPGAGVVAAGFSGLSRLLDAEASGAAKGQDDLENMLEESRSFNARYIALQSQMQMESQAFTAVSNIMRVRHESAQTALNNIR